jgi:PRC-barrel domain
MTALSGLLLSGALAQSTMPAPEAKPAPSAAMPGDGKPQVVTAQKPDQWLASKFRGTDVMGPEKEKIGNVSDILFERNGSVVAYIVGVGGFLGIGSKDVALDPKAFEVVPGDNGMYDAKLKLAMTKDELKNAPAFEKYSPPARTTGTAPGTSPRPAGTTGSTTR